MHPHLFLPPSRKADEGFFSPSLFMQRTLLHPDLHLPLGSFKYCGLLLILDSLSSVGFHWATFSCFFFLPVWKCLWSLYFLCLLNACVPAGSIWPLPHSHASKTLCTALRMLKSPVSTLGLSPGSKTQLPHHWLGMSIGEHPTTFLNQQVPNYSPSCFLLKKGTRIQGFRFYKPHQF